MPTATCANCARGFPPGKSPSITSFILVVAGCICRRILGPPRCSIGIRTGAKQFCSSTAATKISGNANGNANALAALENQTGTQGTIGGSSYIQYFGQIAGDAGQENSTATAN